MTESRRSKDYTKKEDVKVQGQKWMELLREEGEKKEKKNHKKFTDQQINFKSKPSQNNCIKSFVWNNKT